MADAFESPVFNALPSEGAEIKVTRKDIVTDPKEVKDEPSVEN